MQKYYAPAMRSGVTHRMVEAFRAVMLTGNVTRAAAMLNVSQPSISRLIGDFEARLGLSLFERRGARLSARAEAVELFGEVEQSFQGIERIVQRARRIAANRSGALSVAAIPAVGFTILPRAIAGLGQPHRGPEIRLQIGPSQIVLGQLAARQCDLAIATVPASASVGREVARFELSCRLLLPPGHRLARLRRAATPRDLAGEALIALGPGSLTRLGTDRCLAEAGIEPLIAAETQQALSASQLVLQGLGVAVTDGLAARVHQGAGGAALRFMPEIRFAFGLYSAGTGPASDWEGSLAEALREEVADCA